MSGQAAQEIFAAAVHQHHAGDLDSAARLYAQVLAREPRHASSLHLLGVLAQQRGRADLAAEAIAQAIAIDPLSAACHRDLGHALRAQQRLDEAAASYRRALQLQPAQPEVLFALGNLLRTQQKPAAAADCYQRLLCLQPGCAEAHVNLGSALRDQGRLQDAVAQYRKALAIAPATAAAHANLGAALAELGQLEEAVASYRAALALQPAFPEALNNLGNALHEQGETAAAEACFRGAIALRPGFADAHFHLATALLAQGDYAAGWQAFEWRWRMPQMRAAARDFARPQWRGEAAGGCRLLIHAEQGFGDTLQFCRFAHAAAALGLRVLLEVPPPLVRLLRTLPGVEQVITRGEPLPAFDLHCPMMSLPLALGTTLQTIPAAGAYLRADADAVAAWRRRLAQAAPAGLRVGLAWAGNPRPEAQHLAAVDRRRSIPPALLAPLFALPGIAFVSLQKEGPRLPEGLAAFDAMAEMQDFADTAALAAALDLVISVDSAVAHLAAALGRKVWLLNRFDSCWRWLSGRQGSPWYPSVRIFQQPRPGDWPSVIAAVAHALTAQAVH